MLVLLRAVQLTEPSLFLQEHPEVQFVDLLTPDMNGVVRGKRIGRSSLSKVFEKGTNLSAFLLALDTTGSTIESTGPGLDIGDAGRICYPVPGVLPMEPWQKRPTAQLLMTIREPKGDPFFIDPCEVLRQMVARFTKMEPTVAAASELEFCLVDQENANGRPQLPRSPVSGRCSQSVQVCSIDGLDEYIECLQGIIDGICARGIPVDAIVVEPVPTQFEVSLHRVADPMEACDYAVPLKHLVKNVAYDHGMDTTFMARPYPSQTGNGLHVHVSLLDKHGNNVFTSEDPEQNVALYHAIGGVLEALPASMAFPCPDVNSYRHFGSQFYVPNVSSWGLDNRTVALRMPTDNPDAVRLERHVAGTDANPHLLLASVLAGVHHGPTSKVEPSAPIEGNSYEQLGPNLPNNPCNILYELGDSKILAEYIDPKCTDIFVAYKENELEEFEYSIPGLEHNWYPYTM